MMNLKEKCLNIFTEAATKDVVNIPEESRFVYGDIPSKYTKVVPSELPLERMQMADAFLSNTAQKCRTASEVENLIATVIVNGATGYILAPCSKPQCYILEDANEFIGDYDELMINTLIANGQLGEGDTTEISVLKMSINIVAKVFATINCREDFYRNDCNLSMLQSVDINVLTKQFDIIEKNAKVSNVDKVLNCIEAIVAAIQDTDIATVPIYEMNDSMVKDIESSIMVEAARATLCMLPLMVGGEEVSNVVKKLLENNSETQQPTESTNDTQSSSEETNNTSEEDIVEGTAIILPDSNPATLSGPVESVKAALIESNDRFNNCNEDVAKDIAKSFDAIIGKINTKRDGVISLGELNNIMKVEFDHQLSVITSTFQKLMMRNPEFFGTIRRNLDGFGNILNTHRVKLISDISNYSNTDMVLAGVPIENVAVEELCQAKSNAISFLNDFAKTLFEALTVGIIPTEKSKKKNPQQNNTTKDKSSKQEEHAGQHGKNNGPTGEAKANQQPVEKDAVITQQSYYPRITEEVVCNHIIVPPYVTVENQTQENALVYTLKYISTIVEERDIAMNAPMNSVFYITDYKDPMNFVAKRCINTMPDGSYNTFNDQINAAEFTVVNAAITMYFREFRPASGGFIAGWGSVLMTAYNKNAVKIPIKDSEEVLVSVNLGTVTKINNAGGDEVVTNPEVTTKSKPKLHIKKGGVGKVRLNKQDQLILQRMAKKQRRIDLKAESKAKAKSQNNQQHGKRHKNKKSSKQVING